MNRREFLEWLAKSAGITVAAWELTAVESLLSADRMRHKFRVDPATIYFDEDLVVDSGDIAGVTFAVSHGPDDQWRIHAR